MMGQDRSAQPNRAGADDTDRLSPLQATPIQNAHRCGKRLGQCGNGQRHVVGHPMHQFGGGDNRFGPRAAPLRHPAAERALPIATEFALVPRPARSHRHSIPRLYMLRCLPDGNDHTRVFMPQGRGAIGAAAGLHCQLIAVNSMQFAATDAGVRNGEQHLIRALNLRARHGGQPYILRAGWQGGTMVAPPAGWVMVILLSNSLKRSVWHLTC
jgi:hypothetical protein